MRVKNMNAEEKVAYFTTAPIPPLICQMAVPTIISMLVTSFYNMADTIFVGRINTQSTAAVGVVYSVMALIQAIGFFFGHGSGNYISRKLGAKEFEEAAVMAATGFFSAFLAGIVLGCAGLIFLEPLSVFLGSTETILPYTMSYLRIILIGTPFMMSSLVLNNQLRFQGSASYAMVGITAGAVLNIVLDPILIFGFHMGVAGAAAATVISQIVSFLILLRASSKGGNFRIQFRNFKPTGQRMVMIFKGGVPSLCRQGLGSIATICLNTAAGLFGGVYADAAIAAMGIVSRVSMFANSALIGFGQGFQPVCGTNYGAKKYGRVREAFWFCVKVAAVFLVIISAIGFVFAEPVVEIFREDPDVVRIGTLALRLQCVVFPLNSWIVMCNMCLQTIGKSLKASVLAAARQGLFFLPLIYILPRLFGLLGVQMCQTVSDIFTMALALPIGLSVLKELKEGEKQNF
ncbi:MAG: MATE family efflux transporter [Candidatus Limivivens sp.]|nr:MATE family efflux transporter [Candidatus Limivivens sp.]